MESIAEQILQATKIRIYSAGKVKEYIYYDKEYNQLLKNWEGMTRGARQMPAFGVCIENLLQKEIENGVWIEFIFDQQKECWGMIYERLLVQVQPQYCGFNLNRFDGKSYNGRCFYLDLDSKNMSEMYQAIMSMFE